MNKLELMKTANEIRKGIVTAVHSAKSGHPGGSLSAADIYTYLFFEEMNIDPKDPKKADRDRFVLSKGHTARILFNFGKQRILPGRRPYHIAQGRILSSGTSGYEAYSRSRHVKRLAGTGNLRGSRNGYLREIIRR